MERSTSDLLLTRLLDKFAAADCCWFATTRPDGRVHLAPVWHVWHGGAVYVVTKEDAVRTRNVRANPYVSLSLPDPMDVFVIEGIARFAPAMVDELSPFFQQKYAWDITADPPYNTIIAVDPIKAMAWGGHGEGRWRWGSERRSD
jgi:hypothetical protein